MLENTNDGIRYQDKEEIMQIDRMIKSWLELENIPHIDLSKIKLKDRTDYILDIITKPLK